MSDNSDGGRTSTTRTMKRSLSPDHLSTHERKSKIAKIELQQDNAGKDISNKENHIKYKHSEMIMVKHSISACRDEEEEEDQDDGLIIDNLDLSSVPLPWYRSHKLWSNMIAKTFDETYKCHSNFLDAHPAITIKMRSVLCDWLIEVCEVYHLHRETYHLAIAYVDQYLCNTNNFPKAKLQLLGITTLFIASKIEEIYPPRISEFAYVTDKAYYEIDILDMELDIMNALNWFINPMTGINWLSTFLQLESEFELINNSSSSSSSTNVTPSHHDRCIKKRRVSISSIQKASYSSSDSQFLKTSILTNVHRSSKFLQTFSLAVRLLDLCTLDIEYSQFPKNVLSATAILACKPNWPVEQITSLNDDDLYICSEWMKPFFDVLYFGQNLMSIPVPASRPSAAIPIDEVYSIQIHNISLDLLENVYKKRPKFIPPTTTNRPFRNLVNRLSWLPTPPTSLEKQQHDILVNEEEQLQIIEVVSV